MYVDRRFPSTSDRSFHSGKKFLVGARSTRAKPSIILSLYGYLSLDPLIPILSRTIGHPRCATNSSGRAIRIMADAWDIAQGFSSPDVASIVRFTFTAVHEREAPAIGAFLQRNRRALDTSPLY